MFNECLKTVDFEHISINTFKRKIAVKANKTITDKRGHKFAPLIIFTVKYWDSGYHLFYSFNDTILGKGHPYTDSKSSKIMKRFNDQTCFHAIMTGLFIMFDTRASSDSYKLLNDKKFPDLKLVAKLLPDKFWEIFNLIKNEFPFALNQKVELSLSRIREEFKILHKYNVNFERVVQKWDESMVSNVMDG
jgi:hypothetical protein